jgi:hypothetical protein
MIARSDRVLLHTDKGLGDEVHIFLFLLHSGSTAPTMPSVGALRQSRRLIGSRRLCCERSQSAVAVYT